MTTLNPVFIVPSPLAIAKQAEARNAGVVYSTSTPEKAGDKPVVVEAPRTGVTVSAKADHRANTRVSPLRKKRVAKHEFSRLSAPAFDPSLATRNPGR